MSDLKTQDPVLMILQRESPKIQMKKGLLYRIIQRSGKEVCRLILPEQCRPMDLKAMHDDISSRENNGSHKEPILLAQNGL